MSVAHDAVETVKVVALLPVAVSVRYIGLLRVESTEIVVSPPERAADVLVYAPRHR